MSKEKANLTLIQSYGKVYLNGLRDNSKGENKWRDKLVELGCTETKTGGLMLPKTKDPRAFIEDAIPDLYKYATLDDRNPSQRRKEAPVEKAKTNFVIEQDGKDVLVSNPDFKKDVKAKNAFKNAIKEDAGYKMDWEQKNGAYRIFDAKIADIYAIAEKTVPQLKETEMMSIPKDTYENMLKEIATLKQAQTQKMS